MEAIRNAANAAANLVGYDTTANTEQTRDTGRISGGEAPQNTEHTTYNSQSGVEPVSGRLGRGEAGEPYDAGNDDRLSSNYSSQSTNRQGGLTSGLGSGTHNTSSSAPLGEKVASSLGVRGGDDTSRGSGSSSGGPGSGSGSRNDASRLGSAIGQGTNPEKHLYNAKNAPGLGGHRIGDDFSDANTRHEGASKLPAVLGSDAAAGHASGSSGSGLTSGASRSSGTSGLGSNTSNTSGLGSSTSNTSGPTSGLTSGLTSNKGHHTDHTSGSGLTSSSGLGSNATDGIAQTLRYGDKTGENTHDLNTTTPGTRSGPGETLARKAEEYLPGTATTTSTTGYNDRTAQNTSGLTSPTSPTYNTAGTSSLGATGAGLTGSGAGLTGSGAGSAVPRYDGSSSQSNYTDMIDNGCEATHAGYKPHGGHPIGEDAHRTNDGKNTWLDYRNDTTLPISRGKPADK